MANESCGAILAGICDVMQGISYIGKDRIANGYKFRGIDDVMNELHLLFANAKMICVTRIESVSYGKRISKSGSEAVSVQISAMFDLMSCVDGSRITIGPIPAESFDASDKATNKALSVALKYALLQTFLIPTEEPKDPENRAVDIACEPESYDAEEREAIKNEPKGSLTPRNVPNPKSKSDILSDFMALNTPGTVAEKSKCVTIARAAIEGSAAGDYDIIKSKLDSIGANKLLAVLNAKHGIV